MKLPKLGARTIKTGIVIILCCTIPTLFLNRMDVFMACVAGVMCLQNSLEESMSIGKSRIIGTIVGAITGLIFSYALNLANNSILPFAILAGIGVVTTIYTCTVFSIESSISIACVVFLSIFINIGESEWIIYSLNRIVDTFIGVVIGLLVNRYMFVNSFKNVSDEKDD